MFKIKLLILLLINLTIFGCTKNTKKAVNTFNVGYIESDIDGLIAYNFFESHLNSFSALNNQSKFKIYGTISIVEICILQILTIPLIEKKLQALLKYLSLTTIA